MARRGENIYKRKDGRWEGRYKSGYTDDGKTKYRSVYGRSYAEVRQKLVPLKVAVPTLIVACKLTVLELFDEWLSAVKLRVKPSTFANYQMKVEKHILPVFGGMRYDLLTVQMLNGYIEENIDSVALNQDDLLDCYDMGLSTIYLVGDTVFSVSVSVTNVTYIGFCGAKVEIRATGDVDFNDRNIVFKDISFVGDIRPAPPEESQTDNNHVIEETVKIHYSRIDNYDLRDLRDEVIYLYNKHYDEPVIEYSLFVWPEDDVLYYCIKSSSQTITDKRELFNLQDSRTKPVHNEEYYKFFKNSTEKVFIQYLGAEYSLDSIRKAIENDYKSSFEGIVETIRIYIDLDSDSVPVIAYDINAGANSFSNCIKMK